MVTRALFYEKRDPRLFDSDAYFKKIEADAQKFESDWDKWSWSGYVGPGPDKPETYEQALVQREEDRIAALPTGGITLPLSHYIGPGNDLELQKKEFVEPVNPVDELAMKHDEAYSKAKTQDDVLAADLTAIKGMFGEAFKGDAVQFFHGLTGGLGLASKVAFETTFGPVYGVSGKRPADPAPSSQGSEAGPAGLTPPGTPAKQRAVAPEQPVEESPPIQATPTGGSQEMAAAQGGSTGAAYGTAGDNQGPVLIGQGHTPATSRIYTKKFMVETVGTFPTQLSQGTAFTGLNDANNSSTPTFVSTPLMNINPDMLPWYMSPAEHAALPNFTFAEKCKITARPLGYRIPFVTGASTSENANNSATLVQVVWSTGINHKFDGAEVGYSFDATQPTKITGFSEATTDLQTVLYDSQQAAILADHVFYNNYYAVLQNVPIATGNPYLMKAMTICNLADMRGEQICSLEHSFRMAPLKYGQDLGFGSQRRILGAKNDWWCSNYWDGAKGVVEDRDNENRAVHLERNIRITDTNFNYTTFIEKAHILSKANDSQPFHTSPPLLSIGNLPLKSNQLGQALSYLPVIVCWEISTELTCHTMLDDAYSAIHAPFKNHLNLTQPRFVEIDNTPQMNIANGRMYIYGARTAADGTVGSASQYNKQINLPPKTWANLVSRSERPTRKEDEENRENMEIEDIAFRKRYLK